METRPLSRLKRWRLVRIVEAARTGIGQAISEEDVAQAVPTKLTPAPVSAAVPAEAPAIATAPSA
jgi:small subunit ribosomal protein S17